MGYPLDGKKQLFVKDAVLSQYKGLTHVPLMDCMIS